MKLLKTLMLPATARKVRRERLTYLSPDKLASLAAAVRRVKKEGVAGSFLEFGVALGGSAIYLAQEAGERGFTGYDVFGMIPPPGEKDERDSQERYARIASGAAKGLGGDTYYGYEDDLLTKVKAAFARYGVPADGTRVRLLKGLFQDTLSLGPDEAVAFAHIDCDWYDPVLFCITRIAPHLSVGGAMAIDDYNDYAGCKKAVHEALDAHPELRLIQTQPHAILTRAQ
jgi:asparagine synthase (glutamine-hydrolysing)